MSKIKKHLNVDDIGLALAVIGMAVTMLTAFYLTSCSSSEDGSANAGDSSDTDSNSNTGDNPLDALDGDTGAEEIPFDECAAVVEQAENTREPADILFVIDNSKSLFDEIEMVRVNMNDFSQRIMDSGIDPRIVMVSCLPGDCGTTGSVSYGICIDPPLGAADGCQFVNDGADTDDPAESVTDDNNLPTYKHISTRVPSMKGLEWLVTTYADDNGITEEGWHDMIRSNAVKHVVVVSDDGDETTAEEFEAEFTALAPELADFQFHGIFAYLPKDEADASNPCSIYAAPSSPDAAPIIYWDTYTDLVTSTSGVSGDLCEQNFDPVFDALGTSVIASSRLNCEWELPEPPDGETLNSNLVNVAFSSDAVDSYLVGNVPSVADCADVTNGWYYDNPAAPTMIFVCPDTCTWIQGQANAVLDIQFGCETQTVMAE